MTFYIHSLNRKSNKRAKHKSPTRTELCSRRCRQCVLCTLLGKISFFVNLLPYLFIFLFSFWTCILFSSFGFCSSSRITFSFCPGIGDRFLFCFCFCDRSALNLEQCVVIQSDVGLCRQLLGYRDGDDSVSVSLASGVSTDFELEQKV